MGHAPVLLSAVGKTRVLLSQMETAVQFVLIMESLAPGKAVSTEMGWSGRQAPVQSAGAETDTLNAWWLSVSRLHAK